MQRITNTVLVAFLMSAVSLPPAVSQEGPLGIAFVEAPEQGGGVATGYNPDTAFAAARAQCMESGALKEDCLRIAWCFPARWSIDVFVQHREGPHWHEVTCGVATESVARSLVAHICDRAERPELIECSLVQVYDPDGNKLMEN